MSIGTWVAIKTRDRLGTWWWNGKNFVMDETERIEYQDPAMAIPDFKAAMKAVTPNPVEMIHI